MAETQEIPVEALSGGTVDETVPSGVAPEPEPAKPRRGRPKGSVNKVNRIAKEAITEAAPHAFLIRVMQGRKFMRAAEEGAKRRIECYPTMRESISAAEVLLKKVAADLKAVEIGGIPDGKPVQIIDPRERARRILLDLWLVDPATREKWNFDPLEGKGSPSTS